MRVLLSASIAVLLLVTGCGDGDDAGSSGPTSEQYEALEQELGAAQQEIEELTTERDQLAETVASRSSSGDVETIEDIAALRERLEAAEAVAPILGYFAGVDPEIVDPEQYESWPGVVELDMAVEELNDPQLTELYGEHMGEGGFSPGSEELVLRLIELTIEPILEDR